MYDASWTEMEERDPLNENGALRLSRREIIDLLEQNTRRRLGLSAKDFLRLYREGQLDNPGSVADLVVLADLLREDDPLFEAA